MAGIQDYMQSKIAFSFNEYLNLLPLAGLTSVEEGNLASLIYQPMNPSRKKFSNYIVFDSPVPRHIIRPRSFKVCPGCLRESAYIRKIWELIPVTACPIHKCLLLDECPSCLCRLPYNRNSVNRCKCGCDWRDVRINVLEASQLAVSHQIHVLCNLPSGSISTIVELKYDPLYSLPLLDFLSALFFVASQYGTFTYKNGKSHIDTRGKCFNYPMRNKEIHSLLWKAYSTFGNWPANYYAFLDWRRTRSGKNEPFRGREDFGEYKYALYRQLNSPHLNFMRKAYEDYIHNCKYGEYILGIKRLHETVQKNKKYISFNEAVKLLKVSRNGLKLMIVDGRLSAIERPLGKTTRILIELSRINEIKAQLDQLLFKVQARTLLNINDKYIPELLEHDLLKLYYHPADLSNPHRYNLQEIQDLLRKIKRKVSERIPLRQHRKISLTITLERLRNCGVGLGQLLKMILDGDISPCAMKEGCGLGGLFFYESDIVGFLKELIKKPVDGAVRVDEAARLLGLQKTHIHFLISKGLLTTKKVAISRRRLLFVTTSSIKNFSSMYVLPSKLASNLNTLSVHLIRLLAAEEIQPISGPRIDGGKYYVWG